jgi:sulfoxide reductase heme-binding subunit YedZ
MPLISNLLKLQRKPIRINPRFITLLRALIHSTAAIWLAYVFVLGLSGDLPGDPVQYLIDFTGISSLNLLVLSLLISPICEYLKFAQLIRIRKTLGVYAAIYALSHLLVFIVFELQFEWLLIAKEIIDRPYITVGFLGLVILTALLATSFNSVKIKMGQNWFKLHRWVYVALLLICLHFVWSIKSDELAPLVYIGIAGLLLLIRKNKIKRYFK